MNKILLSGLLLIILLFQNCKKDDNNPDDTTPSSTNEFIDLRDGKKYKIIKIGNQTWMAENLKYEPSTGNYKKYSNSDSLANIYGNLYDWQTANHVAPEGWHLPSKSEWETLINYLGGEVVAGGKLKEQSLDYWNAPNVGATNITGFGAKGAGYAENNTFNNLKIDTYFWTITERSDNTSRAYNFSISNDGEFVDTEDDFKTMYFSVRCIKN